MHSFVPIHGEVDILYVGAFPKGVGRNGLNEVGLQVEILELAQASQHPLRQVPQLVKAHLENLVTERQVGLF